ncbi:MAG: nucleotide exchange factor GrpE [Gammaproteobacteria bacterium]|nr:nucleotide exchange factor GrpE [Gammaproteobacteria bacterium]
MAKKQAAKSKPKAKTGGKADAGVQAEEKAQLELTKLQEALQASRAEADENRNLYLRTAAELENVRKRSQRDLEQAHKYALERFSGELLQVKDSLEMGLAAATDKGSTADSLREGMAMTLKLLTAAMEKFGVTDVNPEGEPFNPEFHEAMAMQESPGAAPNTVLTVVQKGYLLNGRLLRPARVIVAREPAGEAKEG